MITDEQRENLRQAAVKKRNAERLQQRAREAYEQALTGELYALTQANREAHFKPAKGKKPEPLAKPDDLRKAAIDALSKRGVTDPDQADGSGGSGKSDRSKAAIAPAASAQDQPNQ